MDNITQEQIDALIEFIDNTEEPASITNVMAAAILAFLNLKVRQMVTVDDLNNEATARENADSLLQGLIDALNQTAVRYSDVGEVVPELGGLGMLALDQSPLVIFKSMGAAFDGVSMEVTLLNGEAKYGGTGNYYSYNRRGTVGSYPLTTNKVYFNSYTGRLYRWNGTAFDAIGGGMDTAIYETIKSNVNLVASKLDALISALAMLAFSDSVNKNTLKVGTLSWVEPETHTPRLTSPVAGSTIDFGTTDEDEDLITKNIFIQGADLTTGLTLAITEGAELFSLAGGSSSISKSGALNGTNITVIYTSSSSVATATGKLRIYSNEVDVTVNLLGKYSEQGGGDEPTPSDTFSYSPTLIPIKRGSYITGSSVVGGITTAEDGNNACTPQFIELSGEWHHVVVRHGFPNATHASKCRLVCKYLKDGVEGVTNYNNSNNCLVSNDIANNYTIVFDDVRTVTVNKQNSWLDNANNAGNYVVTAIAFDVRSNPSIEDEDIVDGVDWSENDLQNSGTTYVDVYKTADDANPTRIFSSIIHSTHTIVE